jgi:hypothetical protein
MKSSGLNCLSFLSPPSRVQIHDHLTRSPARWRRFPAGCLHFKERGIQYQKPGGVRVKEPTARPPGPPSRVDAIGTSRQGLWHWLRCQDIEILELSEIEARTFLQFRQRYLIHRQTARIERRFRHRRSRLQRHHIGLIHLELRYAELAFGIIDYRNHLIECNRDLHPFDTLGRALERPDR